MGPVSRPAPSQVAALGHEWPYLSAGVMSAFCLSSVLQAASHQACVLHGRSVCSVQDVTFSGIVKASFVWPK